MSSAVIQRILGFPNERRGMSKDDRVGRLIGFGNNFILRILRNVIR
jgi:hypothetical protein